MNRNAVAFSLIFILVSFPLISDAQFYAGPKAGVNLNHTKFQDPRTYHPGFHVGAFGRYALLDFLSVNAELTYSQIGGRYDSGYYFVRPEIFRQHVKLNFHSVAVPVFISVTLPSLAEAAIKPALLLGGEYAYSLKVVESYDEVYRVKGEDFISEGWARNATNDYDVHQPAMLFGLGLSMDLFGIPTAIDVRYKSTFKKSRIPNGSSERLKMLSVNVAATLFEL